MSQINDLQFAPLRNLDDFLLGSARFQLPNLSDFEKWGNRVVKNLIYYQTNYFLMSTLLLTIIGIIHPGKMFCGILCIIIILYIFLRYFSDNYNKLLNGGSNKIQSLIKEKNNPNRWIILFMTLAGSCLFLYVFDSILIVIFAILLVISSTFVHASLRLRNIKNKVATTMETLGNRNTPMGIFLDSMHLLPDLI